MRRTSQGHANIQAYWRNSEIRDNFWRKTFPQFIEPLKPVFADPAFAGASLLAVHIADPASLREKFTNTPERFGELYPDAVCDLDAVLSEITDATAPTNLKSCAKSFMRVQNAVKQLDAFAKKEPVLFRSLERKRIALAGRTIQPRPARAYTLNLKF